MKALPRIIPVLLLKNGGLYKTRKFKDPKYVGDPINAVKIFNEKEVDELMFLDIMATLENKKPPFEFLEKIAGECFMPLSYGGGLKDLETINAVLKVGIEKVVISSYAVENPAFIRSAADKNGSSTISVCLDVKKNFFGKYEVWIRGGTKSSGKDPVKLAVEMDRNGVGELIVNSIDRDGLMLGYDLDLLKKISGEVGVPVIACGGAGNINHMHEAVNKGGVSSIAAGSMFVFNGKHRAVLITYPGQKEIKEVFSNQVNS